MEDTNILIKKVTVDIISIFSIWGMIILHRLRYKKFEDGWTNIYIMTGVLISQKYLFKYCP
jgi:hypothetical protein